jgi:DUF4097 and DUF4098 domain-containing protein YvlB
MSEERMRILDMVREGKITAEDGVKLLEAVNSATGTRGEARSRPAGADDPFGGVVNAVMEAIQSKGWGSWSGSWSSGPLRGLERRREREAEGWEFVTLSDGDHGTFDVPAGARLVVENEAGSVHTQAVDGPARLDLEGDSTHSFGVYVARKGDEVVVAAHRTEHHARLPRLRVSVPRSVARVEMRTGGGSLHVRGLNQPVALKTSGGSITVEGHGEGDVDARTSGGGIKVEGRPGRATLHTSGGSIRFQGQTDALDAKTSGGSIHIDGARLTSGEHRARTSGGSVRVMLAPESSVVISASTSAGNVSVDLPGAQGTHSGSRISPRYSGTYNGSGAKLDVSTAAGSVSIGLASAPSAERAPAAPSAPAAPEPPAEPSAPQAGQSEDAAAGA